jgi:hypothetical protein
MKNVWKNVERLGLVLSIPFSIAAFWISIKSCDNSNEAIKMTTEEFKSKRILILQGVESNFLPGFKIDPINQNQILRKIKIIFPNSLLADTVVLNSPDFQVSLSELQDKLILIIDSSNTSLIKTKNFQINGLFIPSIIESEYIAESSIYKDRSLYNLEFNFINNLVNNDDYLNFDNLTFVKSLNDLEGIKTNLDVILEQNLNNIKIIHQ